MADEVKPAAHPLATPSRHLTHEVTPDSPVSGSAAAAVVTPPTTRSNSNVSLLSTPPRFPVGTRIRKYFPGYGWFIGKVVQHRPDYGDGEYSIQYEDDDSEDMNEAQVQHHVQHFKSYCAKQKKNKRRSKNRGTAEGEESDSKRTRTASHPEQASIQQEASDERVPDVPVSSRSTSEENHHDGVQGEEPVAVKQEAQEPDMPLSTPAEEAQAAAPADDAEETKIKTEQDLNNKIYKEFRHYGDRVLLRRQAPNGMMKLGGGNCTMELIPSFERHPDHPRFNLFGHRMAIAYNDSWNMLGPKFAGQPSAHVSYLHLQGDDPTLPFSVFMKRTIKNTRITLGWEYCGEYRSADPERDVITYEAAYNVKQRDKNFIVDDMQKSLLRENGLHKFTAESWREKLASALFEDDCIPGPQWMVEGHKRPRTEAEEKAPQYPLAGRARALGFTPSMSDHDLVALLVELDEFYETVPIVFVAYDETMFDFVKEGETNMNAQGKKKQNHEPCAKASDWYAYHDQLV